MTEVLSEAMPIEVDTVAGTCGNLALGGSGDLKPDSTYGAFLDMSDGDQGPHSTIVRGD